MGNRTAVQHFTIASDDELCDAGTNLNNSATLEPNDKSVFSALPNWTNLVTLGKDIVL
jgi:hypothetical protein